MRIQKKHKVYAGLVGTALAAWAVDAMFLRPETGRPSAAAAAASPQSAEVIEKPPASGDDATVANQWLADRLAVWSRENPAAQNRTRDVFGAPLSWARQLAAPSTQPVTASATIFKRDHHIAAVILDPRGGTIRSGSIMIDGRLVRVGQSIGGCRLVAVSQGRAAFIAADGERFTMAAGSD